MSKVTRISVLIIVILTLSTHLLITSDDAQATSPSSTLARPLSAGLDKVFYTRLSPARVYSANLDGSGETLLYTYPNDPIIDALAVDLVNDYVYIATEQQGSSFTLNSIDRIKSDGTGFIQLRNTGTQFALAVAYDPINNKVYWNEQISPVRMMRMNPDGSSVEQVRLLTNQSIRDLEIDPLEQKVYWSDGADTSMSFQGVIRRADVGVGTSVQTIWSNVGVNRLEGVALNQPTCEIFWVRRTDALIQKGNMDGSGSISTVLSGSGNVGANARGIAIHRSSGRMFWTDLNADVLKRANLDGTGVTTIASGVWDAVAVGNPLPASLAAPASLDLGTTGSATAGTPVNFTVTGANLSPANAVITITAPANVEVSTTGPTSGYGSTATLTAVGGSISGSNNVWARIAAGAPVGAVSGNLTYSGGTVGCPSPTSVSGTVTSNPNLTATKTNNVGGATTLGNSWTWTINIANNDTGAATFSSGQTIFSDNLPNANLSYGTVSVLNATNISGSVSCSIATNNLTCTASGGSVIIGASTGSFDIQFSATPSAVGTFANPRGGGSCGVDPGGVVTESNESDNSCSDTVTVQAVDLQLSKDDGGVTAVPGGTIIYTLAFTNAGDIAASNVVLTETVPTTTTFNAGASSGWSCTPDSSAGSQCTLAIATLAGGGSNGTADFAVDVDNPLPAGATQIANTAEIGDDGSNGPDANDADNTAGDVTPVNAAPDLQLSKDDGGVTAVPGGTISYTLTFTNAGDIAASNVVLTEIVPSNTTFNAGASSGWSCTPDSSAGSQCTLAIAALAGGGSNGTADFAVDVDNPLLAGVTQIDNTAEIGDDGSNGPDANEADNTAGDVTPVNASADLQLSKEADMLTVEAGETIIYTLVYTNAGNQDAAGVVLTEAVPASTTFNAGNSSGGWSCTPDNSAGSLCTLAIGPLTGNGNGGQADFAVDVDNPIDPSLTEISNTAQIGDDDGQAGTASASVPVTVGSAPSALLYLPLILKDFIVAPDLVITDLQASSNAVTVTIRNSGNAPVVDAFWVDVYFNPSKVPALNEPWDTIAGQGVTWGLVGSDLPIAPGQSRVLTLATAAPGADLTSPPPYPAGATVYALADSVNFSTSYGAVQESDESNNLAQSTVTAAGAGPTAHPAATGQSPPPAALPRRW
jgi:uncharacterized repeat protein (TIGR01451 family)